MTQDSLPVSIHSRNNHDLPATPGQITRVNFDAKDRSKNSIKALGMWLGFTFASIFVPILHFVLVPSLFITSWVMFIEKSRETQRNEGGTGECPKCHQAFQIEKSKWTHRLIDTCGNCHDDLEINIPDTAAGLSTNPA